MTPQTSPSRGLSRRLSLAATAATTVFGVTLWLVRSGRSDRADARAFAILGGAHGGLIDRAAEPCGKIAPAVLILAILAALWRLAARRAWADVGVIVAGFPLAFAAAKVIKQLDRRPRPAGPLIHAAGYAFPSTDSAVAIGALVVAIIVARTTPDRPAPRRLVAAGALATFAAGMSFIVFRVHYLTDVIAGWALGVVVFSACALVALAAGR